MPVYRVCCVSGCGRLIERGSRCHEHEREKNAAKSLKMRQHGRQTQAWQKLRRAALERDGYRCRRCGTSKDMTVHLDPRLGGRHNIATLDDLLSLCRSCHGTIDGPRASIGRR